MWVLAAVVALSTASAIVSWRADDQLYEPDIVLAAFGDVPNDPERAEELATWLAAEAIRSLRIEERLDEFLPFGTGIIVRPVLEALEGVAISVTTRLVRTELFADVWADALPAVHQQLVLLVEGSDEGLLTTDGGAVVVDLDAAILASYDLIAEAIPDIPDDSLFARVTGVDTAAIKETIGEFLERALPEDLVGFPLFGEEAIERVRALDSQLQLILWLSIAAALSAAAAAVVLERRRWLAVGAVAGAALVGVVIGALSVARVESVIVDALRDLPWDGGGTVEVVLDWWTTSQILALVFIGALIAAQLVRLRGPAPGRHGPAGAGRPGT